MKLLLTGLPGTGKTTLFRKILPSLDCDLWIVSEELRDLGGQRIGFKARSSDGASSVFAHKTEVKSEATLGDYLVDIKTIDRLFTQLISKVPEDKFVAIDEIGRMQMLSPTFKKAVLDLFSKNFNILATIRYGDDWTREFTAKNDVITFTLAGNNHKEIEDCLVAAAKAAGLFNNLSDDQKRMIIAMAKQYLARSDFTQFKKLFNNAVVYLAEFRVERTDDNHYKVNGNHASHRVVKTGDDWACDCDLFNGKGAYAGRPGICSHIQAAQLL
ncbi:MAG TPA: nucleoside-triphosphatase [Candidatus Saccharimonadales bacterium]|nr:nucleoside-triphosphatase [Candidatus Saccharimonadales bacterium]